MKRIAIGASIAVGVWLIGAGTVYWLFPDWPTRGQFGDMFGAMNALFSSMALIGVVATVWIQKQELELQRKELEMTRDELRRAAIAQEQSSASLAAQLAQQTTASRLNGLSALLSSIEAQIEQYAADNRTRRASATSPFDSIGGWIYDDEKKLRIVYREKIESLLNALGEEMGVNEKGTEKDA